MAFKRQAIINKANEYLAMSMSDIQNFCSDKIMSEFDAIVIISNEYNVTESSAIEDRVSLLYESAVPEVFKEALSNLSKTILVAIIVKYFKELLSYANLRNKSLNNKTFDVKLTDDGLKYYKNLYDTTDDNIRAIVAKKSILLPQQFKLEHKYIISDIALCYLFDTQFDRYKYVMSEAEFRAIFYSQDVICKLENITAQDVPLFVRSFLKLQATTQVNELRAIGYTDNSITALLLCERANKLNMKLLKVNIPGECKDRLKEARFGIMLSHRLKNFQTVRYTGKDESNKVYTITVKGKKLLFQDIKKLLSTKLPLAILSMDGAEGIYLNSNDELESYKPVIQEEG